MKKLFIITLLFCSGICKGQEYHLLNDSVATYHGDTITALTSSMFVKPSFTAKDSCWWTKKVDTIPTDFVIIVDENDFVKKQRIDFIVHKYEVKDCYLYNTYGLWVENTRNEVYLLNGEPAEILLYRQKGENRSLVIGNSE